MPLDLGKTILQLDDASAGLTRIGVRMGSKLHNADQARVQRQKITEYLLSPTNPSGRSKAAFFSRFGFGIEQWEALAEALYSHCLQNQVLETRETAYGMQYVIVGPISTPDGRNPTIRTVWQVDNGADHPRFITARPAR